MCPLNPFHQKLNVFLGEEKFLYLTPHPTPPYPKDLSAIFKPTRRKPGPSPGPARLVSNSGTKAAPLLRSGDRGYVGYVILSVSHRNVSAALSLLNKVYNSIYFMRLSLFKSERAQPGDGRDREPV
jgi:hypothetical protein